MSKVSLVWLLPLFLLLGNAWGHQELSNLLEQQKKDFDLSPAEVDALRPLYRELQAQYDYIYSQKLQDGDGSAHLEQPTDLKMDDDYAKAFDELRAQFAGYVSYKPSIDYDTSLPTLEQLIGSPRADMTEQELMEWQDLQAILQDVIDESQLGINQLVKRAIDLEINLLTLNKPKIVLAVIAGLETMWKFWGRGAQAAYCSYSHVPQFTEALHAINGGVDCYTYTMGIVLKIQNETVASIKEIKRNIQGLVKIYQKIAAKKTLMGQILTGTLNVFSALRRVHDIIAVGIAGYDKVNNELPGAAQHSAQCGVDFVNSIPQMIETTQNVTTCITFVNPDKPDYEFLKPEEDRYYNTGGKPEDIPHENDVDEDDDDDNNADHADDDYVDHR
ncbi:uncharacterized protein LOC117792791 [Drosophila innubila]|uniref:uncharacterized protein LOC117792791 n=1 Tax=Drosophila innubila TaxID=198719 RepID=UPI00148D9FD7|nr:uncharacterized protein LOC117792791 [Drosophila innubila]